MKKALLGKRKSFRRTSWGIDRIVQSRLGRHFRRRWVLEPLEDRWVPAPLQFFFVPIPAQQALTSLEAIGTGSQGNDITSFINITASESGTILHYDQWEDGYEPNLNTPLQKSTQIWGDNDPSNGMPPGFATDVISAGQVVRLRNDIPANPRDPANFFFDGGDRIGANRLSVVAHGQFTVATGSLLTTAVEVRDTRYFDTSFTAPVGTDTANAGQMFEYCAFFVMASQDNTTVQIDRDDDGTFDQTFKINQGQSIVSAANILEGGRVVTDKPVQVNLLTGDIGSNYASRSYTLYSDAQVTNDYFTPVGLAGTADPIRLFVYNPNPAAITVNYETQTTSGKFNVPAGTSTFFDVPNFLPNVSGTRLFSTSNFMSLGAHDQQDSTHDWGFSMQAVNSLTQIALVALGVGNSSNPPSISPNTSPIWVTPISATRVYVDWDGDPTTGGLIDPLGGKYDQHFDLAKLQSQRVYDTVDKDNSGMRLYTTTGVAISTAWGEDITAPTGSPGFDAGTSVLAVPVPEVIKFADFAPGGDVNGDGLFNSGDRVRYGLRITNNGTLPISNAQIVDTLPPEVSYVGNTTFIDSGMGATLIPDSGITPFPLDETGYTLANLASKSSVLLSFDVIINSNLPAGTTMVTNYALMTYDIFRLPAVNTIGLRSFVGDFVWNDQNGNGIQDAGEPGINGVTVRLLDASNTVIATTTTSASGYYSFSNLMSGKYSVEVVAPAGYFFGKADQGANDQLDSDVNSATGRTAQFNLLDGEINSTIDAGLVAASSIGGFVYLDANNNGNFEVGETPSGGIDVQLTGTDDLGNPINVTIKTQPDGSYVFSDLRPGIYTVTEVGQPAGTLDGKSTIGTPFGGAAATNIISNVVVTPGGTGVNYNFADVLGSIGDFVWHDVNGNGVQDGGEPGIANAKVAVTWFGPDGKEGTGDDSVVNTTTDANGKYLVSGLFIGAGANNYRVTVSNLPAGITIPTFDLDGIGTPNTALVALKAGNSDARDVDFGFRASNSIGDFVWVDVDGDGVQDGTPFEPGLPGIGITLTWLGFDGKVGGGDDVITKTTTDVLGYYQFNNLPDGNFVITVDAATLPTNVTATFDLNGPLDNSATRTLTSGENATDVDFGYKGNSGIGDTIWYDVDGNGVQNNAEPGIAGASAVLLWSGADGKLGTADDVPFGTPVDANGKYLFTGLPIYGADDLFRVFVTPPVAFTVATFDADGLATPNQSTLLLGANQTNLLQDFGYRGTGVIGDRVFEDLNGNGIQDVGEPDIDGVTVTLLDATGVNILNSTVTKAGAYSFTGLAAGLYVVQFTAPAGFAITAADQGADDSVDSDADPADGKSLSITLASGETNTTVDAGMYRPISVGDFVWFDIDGDGIQDVGEPGIPNVNVTITWLGPDGIAGGGDDQIFVATTDSNGKYTINNLPPGNYIVAVGSLPNGLTIPTFGSNSFTLKSGVSRTDIDFGFKGPGNIGDQVWYDVNRDGVFAGEPGIANVTVRAVWAGFDDKAGTADDVTFTTKTNAGGSYGFGNLPLGDFQVSVDTATLPVGLVPTFDLDSGTTSPNNTTAVALTVAAPSEIRADFGYTGKGSIGDRIWLDFNGDGVQDIGEPGLSGVSLTLIWAGPDGNLATVGDNVTLNTVTGANGLYVFSDLPPGTYDVKVFSGLPGSVTNTGDPDATPDGQTTLTLTVDQNRTDIDFGYQGGSSIAGFVYRDFSVDGIRQLAGMNPETGIGNVTVSLSGTDIAGSTIKLTTKTAADGSYQFPGLLAGDYTITETQPPSVFVLGINGFYDGLDTPGTIDGVTQGSAATNDQIIVTVPSGKNAVEYNFGENPPADPFGFVYVDSNNNGVRETGEPGIPGVQVTISGTAFAGTKLARPLTAADVPGGLTTTTNASGKWEFQIVPPGVYTLRETQPVGFADGLEQDGDPSGPPATIGNDQFDNVQLQPFPVRGPFNFGELIAAGPPAGSGSLSGSVFLDLNNNGIREPNELGLPGVLVTITGKDLAGNAVTASVKTDINGTFTFIRITPGTYTLTETQPTSLNLFDGIDMAGTLGGSAGNDVITNIVVGNNAVGVRYQFAERLVGFIKENLLASEITGTQLTGAAGTGIASITNPSANGKRQPNGSLNQLLVTGADAGGGPHVRVFDAKSGAPKFSFFAFQPTFTGGVRVATGDVTGDGFDDVIVGAGPGGGPHVKVFDGNNGLEVRSFFAFASSFIGGVFVASGDVNNDGWDDVVVGADVGGGPHVKVISGKDGQLLAEFFAYSASFAGGVRVAAGDVNGDGLADVITGAGPGGGPHVRVFDHGANSVIRDFFAFEPSLTSGVFVTTGDADGDGQADIIAGIGAGPQVRVFNGASGAILNALASYGGGFNGGIRVAAVDINNDGVDELVTGAGRGGGPHVRVLDSIFSTPRSSFFAYDPSFLGGIFVG